VNRLSIANYIKPSNVLAFRFPVGQTVQSDNLARLDTLEFPFGERASSLRRVEREYYKERLRPLLFLHANDNPKNELTIPVGTRMFKIAPGL